MASFDRPVKVDAKGNIDTSQIEKELNQALEFDVKYKQKDNMKKKAIKTAGDYDQFKAMVDCAHLKTLTSKEVESLGKKKSGWQKEYTASRDGAAQILEMEEKEKTIRSAGVADMLQFSEIDGKPSYEPQSSAVVENDMTSLATEEEKVVYLKVVGLKRIKKLLKGDCSAELMEQLVRTVLFSHSKQKEERASNASASEEAAEPLPSLTCIKWLKAVSSVNRFALLLQFAPKGIIQEAVAALEEVVGQASEEDKASSGEVLNKFKAIL